MAKSTGSGASGMGRGLGTPGGYRGNIVSLARRNGVTDIGQLTKGEKQQLTAAVRKGTLRKTKNFNYPNPVPMYARPFTKG